MHDAEDLKPTLMVAPVQATDVRMLATALEEAGALRQYVTLTAPSEWQRRVLSRIPGFSRYSRRMPSPVARSRTKQVVMGDVLMRMGRTIGYSPVDASDMALACVDRASASAVRPPIECVLAREDGCMASFTEARKRGMRCVYQLPTAYFETVRVLMGREAGLFPGLCDAAEAEIEFSASRCARKASELSLSDAVLCPSAFVLRSIPEAEGKTKTLKALPFGFDRKPWSGENPKRGPLFMYAGNISVRKGVHRVLIAWKRLGAHRSHRLLLVGDMQLPGVFLKEFKGAYEHVPRLPHAELQALYRSARALVFNAMADGFGLVISEAMCASTPVLASRNCGAPDVVSHGVEGRLFDFGDDEALCQTLDWALSHPDDLREMGENARRRSASWTWDEYRVRFVQWMRDMSSVKA